MIIALHVRLGSNVTVKSKSMRRFEFNANYYDEVCVGFLEYKMSATPLIDEKTTLTCHRNKKSQKIVSVARE